MMNNLEQNILKKSIVEIKKVYTTTEEPYLLLLITKENDFSITSTNDIEFYEIYKEAAEKVKSNKWECNDSKTRELLEEGIDEIYKKFYYPEEIYIEGKESYTYKKLCELMEEAKKVRENSLYDWKKEIVKNLCLRGCYIYQTSNDEFYARAEKKGQKIRIELWDGMNFKSKRFVLLNIYFSMFLSDYYTSDKTLCFDYLNSSKWDISDMKEPDIEIDEETIRVVIGNFDPNIRMFTRQLALPYDDFIEKLNKHSNKDEFKLLDWLDSEYNYPRAEIKNRIREFNLIKEMENRNSTLKQKTKEKLRGLIGFRRRNN